MTAIKPTQKGSVLGVKAIAEENCKAEEKQAMRVVGLGPESHKALVKIRGEVAPEVDSGAALDDAMMEIQEMGREDNHQREDIAQEDDSFVHAVQDIIDSQWKAH
ncbi:uncharacterized protein LAESUDRAFT_755822 [Laetiporus sulphureus 93-53]|uniref:Uncharacterized protein n=1 Tax=Laetiporus sulphureus 93-53 TaxID=1314785 RepID=A0A165GGJ5_9APHY|nr:uncharacterized protein LAESUDRAFT_755822 [Laetiporus sulphureus 93-53]KZT10314.1 hypothetical protein LAESUDRAFT_755822 [Laetiporus sulphureus 93-53]